MAVLFVLPSFAGGGAERVTLHLANGLAAYGHSIHLATLNGEGPLASLRSDSVILYDLAAPRLRQGILPLIRLIRALRPAVVFSTLVHVNIALLAARPLLPQSTRLWIREANMPSLSLAKGVVARSQWWLSRCLYRQADRLIVTSERMRAEFTHGFAVPDRILCRMPNPVDEQGIRTSLTARPPGWPGGGRHFVASGRLTHQKGFDRLIPLFGEKEFASDHLTLLGDGSQRESLMALAERQGCADRVHFAGFVATPWPLYAAADAFLLPSRWEGMPNAALEALTCGTPVIATPESGGIAEVAAAASAGAVTVADFPDSFRHAMQAVEIRGDTFPHHSLLPRDFCLDDIVRQFNQWL